MQNVLQVYRQHVEKMDFMPQTRFAPVLQEVLNYSDICKKGPTKFYHCLVILTDGGCEDLQETKDLLVKMAKEPISVIIIGVGKNHKNFANMVELDADKVALKNA